MTELRILDLLANSSVGPAAHLDPKTVQKYAERRGDLPPVVVFETSDGLLLVDGYHRVAAAQRRAQSNHRRRDPPRFPWGVPPIRRDARGRAAWPVN